MYSSPEVAKQLLLYRYNILPNAEKRAAEMDDVGALYSWNSINGEECGHVFEAATAQYHLNCDIFYAIKRYYLATDDWQFMKDYGIEMLAKTSKCLSHRGNFIDHKGGKFCINGICGPTNTIPSSTTISIPTGSRAINFTLRWKCSKNCARRTKAPIFAC